MPTYPLLKHFTYEHLPEHLQVVSREFHALANHLAEVLPHDPETTVALRKLIESKDAAVRSAITASRT